MKKLLNDFIKNEDGVTAIEYAVIGVAMAAVVGIAMNGSDGQSGLKKVLQEAFTNIQTQVENGSKPPSA
ncbi:Flp family type IVb pilin [Vibrio europaeus]|uniref:Flp family type IVb pilin n=1 Tax=Vibrio europaeus TaxID=300876 RepID=A0A178J673_9VIBR|nr:Flp family type IVb pilin [Vibrio europaeus]MDC5705782.1 Flp family type IVb pilin [Vibrio europaeus]MDC5709192.1 Flp family type IVb pilin [Vibrio europaeus]MDC5713591.1 Flp family type IVb pilin [Vibrio europaeus]MDC5720311.1 Flp family type IVb pilin [Vibrio europaeus]MDC5723802.1 Flp family type IVb pilin [Vibrio europaeus]